MEGGAAAGDAVGAAQASSPQPEEEVGSWERALNVKAQQAEPFNPYALFSAAAEDEPQASAPA